MKLTCRRCKSHGPFAVVRGFHFIADAVNDDGEFDSYAEWNYANELRHTWINCQSCGNSWRTTRDLPIYSVPGQ